MHRGTLVAFFAFAGILLVCSPTGVAQVLEVPAQGTYTLPAGAYEFSRAWVGVGAKLEITGDVKLVLKGPPDADGVVLRLEEGSRVFGTPAKGANGTPGVAGERGQDGAPGSVPGADGAPGTNGTGGTAGSPGEAGQSGFRLVIEASGKAILAGDILLPGGDGGTGAAGGPGGNGGNGGIGAVGGCDAWMDHGGWLWCYAGGTAGGSGGDGADGGNGGPGGHGGAGGNGGAFQLLCQGDVTLSGVPNGSMSWGIQVNGGRGGVGGIGGNGGAGGDGGPGREGFCADSGATGNAGRGSWAGPGGRGGDGGAGGVIEIVTSGYILVKHPSFDTYPLMRAGGGNGGNGQNGGAGGPGGDGHSGGSEGLCWATHEEYPSGYKGGCGGNGSGDLAGVGGQGGWGGDGGTIHLEAGGFIANYDSGYALTVLAHGAAAGRGATPGKRGTEGRCYGQLGADDPCCLPGFEPAEGDPGAMGGRGGNGGRIEMRSGHTIQAVARAHGGAGGLYGLGGAGQEGYTFSPPADYQVIQGATGQQGPGGDGGNGGTVQMEAPTVAVPADWTSTTGGAGGSGSPAGARGVDGPVTKQPAQSGVSIHVTDRNLVGDGVSSTPVKVTAWGANGHLQGGQSVNVVVDDPTIGTLGDGAVSGQSSISGTTNAWGQLLLTFTAGTKTGAAVLTATRGVDTDTTSINVAQHGLGLTADPDEVPADGTSYSVITVFLVLEGQPAEGATIWFESPLGTLRDPATGASGRVLPVQMDANGEAVVHLLSTEDEEGLAVLSAEYLPEGWTATAEVRFIKETIELGAFEAYSHSIPGRDAGQPTRRVFIPPEDSVEATLFGRTVIPISASVEGFGAENTTLWISSPSWPDSPHVIFPRTVTTNENGVASFELEVTDFYEAARVGSESIATWDLPLTVDVKVARVDKPWVSGTLQISVVNNYRLVFQTYENHIPPGHVWDLSDPFNVIQAGPSWPLIVSGLWAGDVNNILDMIWTLEHQATGLRVSPYGPYTCGCYQMQVLEMLDQLRLGSIGETDWMLNGLDYGGVMVLWGSHQAAMMWPMNRPWNDLQWGRVLDPWMAQTPSGQEFALSEWIAGMGVAVPVVGWALDLWLAPGSSNGEVLRSYPNTGNPYPPTPLNAGSCRGGETLQAASIVVHCPVEVMLTDASGRRCGFLGGQPEGSNPFVNEIPGADLVVQWLADGTRAYVFHVPPAALTMHVSAVGDGRLDLTVLNGRTNRQSGYHGVDITQGLTGSLLFDGDASPGALALSDGRTVPAQETPLLEWAPADFDRDLDVDLEDLAALRSCASGPAVPHNRTDLCTAADFDRDDDVDHDDFGTFQRCYSGATQAADPNCAE